MGSRMLRPWTLSTLAILALALPLGAAARPGASRPAPFAGVTQFQLPHPDPGSGPYGITVGADGNLWFTERYVDRIGKLTTDGQLTEYGGLSPQAQPWDIAVAGDGSLWFTEENIDQVASIDYSGTVREY